MADEKAAKQAAKMEEKLRKEAEKTEKKRKAAEEKAAGTCFCKLFLLVIEQSHFPVTDYCTVCHKSSAATEATCSSRCTCTGRCS